MKLTNKRAVVVGGSTGLGLGVAAALCAHGAEVVVTGTDEARLAAARRALGASALVLRSDITRLAEVRALAARVQERFGSIDAVFLNTGFCQITPFQDVSEDEYDRTFAVNTKGAFFTAQVLAPLLSEGGAFVFTTSIANQVGYPGMSVYAGAKAALRSLSQVLAAELLPRKIRANCLSPGFVDTPTMGLNHASESELQAFRSEGDKLTPMGRMASIEEAARAALFLAFEATFTTGSELMLDGGMTQVVAPPAA